ncbi:hypothetical protein SAMN05216267_1006147 [Actinacidiphila rubida]|uniref:Uncharacterized protein n=1 Tax=Actinacidiphila rubida TaxID=310780 RepID=A0A1H8HB47_9ACTN|nr:hypothetical protein [Actinacidiphila rubida]SEN53264.1 hypothetical protein SAMN05216267_1006147 [Actinacidiphila rubida]
MTRSSRTPRQLVIGGDTFLWSVRHEHHGEPGHYEDCCEVLTVRRPGALGRFRVVFASCPGHLVPDGYTPSGTVGTTDGRCLNLHEPGTVRALLDAVTSRGDLIVGDGVTEVDGWTVFPAVAADRPAGG